MAQEATKARELAKELSIEIEKVLGTGKGGFVLVADVELAAELPETAKAADPVLGVTKPTPVNTRVRDEGEPRGVLNHLKDGDAEADGMTFKRPGRGTLDHSTNKRLYIPKKYLNNELHYHFATDSGGR